MSRPFITIQQLTRNQTDIAMSIERNTDDTIEQLNVRSDVGTHQIITKLFSRQSELKAGRAQSMRLMGLISMPVC